MSKKMNIFVGLGRNCDEWKGLLDHERLGDCPDSCVHTVPSFYSLFLLVNPSCGISKEGSVRA